MTEVARSQGRTRLVGAAVLMPVILAVLWAVIVGFAFPVAAAYRPDGIYYTDMTLRFSGLSPSAAAAETLDWYRHVGIVVPASYLDPASNPDWLLVQPRLVYPLASVPFVRILGVPGMLVIPVLSLLLTVELIAAVGRRVSSGAAAFAVALMVLASPFVFAWSASDVTDPVAMAESAVLVALMLVPAYRTSRGGLVAVGSLAALLCFTRQLGPFVVGLVGAPWFFETIRLRRIRNRWLPAAAVAAAVATACTAVTLWWAPYPLDIEMTRATGYSSLVQAVANYPTTVVRMAGNELSRVITFDHPLLVILLLALLAGLRSHRAIVSLALGASISALAVAAVNGTLNSDFRYLLPAVPPLALAAAVGLDRVTGGRAWSVESVTTPEEVRAITR